MTPDTEEKLIAGVAELRTHAAYTRDAVDRLVGLAEKHDERITKLEKFRARLYAYAAAASATGAGGVTWLQKFLPWGGGNG